jgi:NTE family protein
MTWALVLGSGGLTGIAWEAGVLKGLADSGFPVGAASLR